MDKQKMYRIIRNTFFCTYIAFLVYVVFFAEMFGRTMVSSGYRYNLVPFKEIMRFATHFSKLGYKAVIINIAGNIAAFVPLGFCLPMITEQKWKFGKVALMSFTLSLSIELIQLLTRVGCCDVDDLILNTFGGMLGYTFYVLFRWLRNRLRAENSAGNEQENN